MKSEASCLSLKKRLDIGDGIGLLSKTKLDNLTVLTADKLLLDKYDNKLRRKIGVSLASGCGVGCRYCFTNNYAMFRPLSAEEITEQVEIALAYPLKDPEDLYETKISFKQMGDPLLNPKATLKAIDILFRAHPDFTFVVSTSAPEINFYFFDELRTLNEKGVKIRLQFSCHTTSDSERAFLSPKIKMMAFSEIAEVVNRWRGEPVTLNFVMFDGYTYDVSRLRELFDPSRVFVKINYIDRNSAISSNDLFDMKKDRVDKIISGLKKAGFKCARRH